VIMNIRCFYIIIMSLVLTQYVALAQEVIIEEKSEIAPIEDSVGVKGGVKEDVKEGEKEKKSYVVNSKRKVESKNKENETVKDRLKKEKKREQEDAAYKTKIIKSNGKKKKKNVLPESQRNPLYKPGRGTSRKVFGAKAVTDEQREKAVLKEKEFGFKPIFDPKKKKMEEEGKFDRQNHQYNKSKRNKGNFKPDRREAFKPANRYP